MEGASACLTSACKPTFARNALPLAKWVLALCFFKPGEAELHYRSVHSAFASLQGTQLSAGAMYAVRVSGSSVDEALSAQASQLAEQLIAEQAGSSRSAAPDADLSEVSFSAGNPRVEHLTGTVHLYRHWRTRCGGMTAWAGQPQVAGTSVKCHTNIHPRPAMPSSLIYWKRYMRRTRERIHVAKGQS